MTIQQLREKLNNEFGLNHKWPKTYEVDADTYANVCQSIFEYKVENKQQYNLGNSDYGQFFQIKVDLGTQKCGILFKDVELILNNTGVSL